MIIRNVLFLCLVSNASSFFVGRPLSRPAANYASHLLQVSLSESSSEVESAEFSAGDDKVEVEDIASGVVGDVTDSLEEEPTLGETAEEEKEDEKQLPSTTERHTVYVGNLPYSVEVKEIRDLFSEHVDVRYINLPKDRESGRVKGFAFVDVGSADDVPKAIDALNGIELEDRKLRVNRYLAKDQIRSSKTADGSKKLYVGNIPYGATREDLSEFFSEFGDVLDVFIPVNRYGESRGFAFISVKEEDIDAILENTNQVNFMGRNIVVNIPLAPGEKPTKKVRQDVTKLFVGNLSFYTQSETLEEVFEEFGKVIDCYIPTDSSNGNSRGFGFISMEKEAALAAIEALDGCELDGRMISVNEARPREPRGKPMSDDVENEEDEE